MEVKFLAAVGLGGGLGAMLRVLFSHFMPTHVLTHIPLPILVINIIGCFAMGLLTEAMAFYWAPSETMRAFITTGVLGGFTTFSAFSLEYALLVEKDLLNWAFIYALMTFLATLLAFFAGLKIIRYTF